MDEEREELKRAVVPYVEPVLPDDGAETVSVDEEGNEEDNEAESNSECNVCPTETERLSPKHALGPQEMERVGQSYAGED